MLQNGVGCTTSSSSGPGKSERVMAARLRSGLTASTPRQVLHRHQFRQAPLTKPPLRKPPLLKPPLVKPPLWKAELLKPALRKPPFANALRNAPLTHPAERCAMVSAS